MSSIFDAVSRQNSEEALECVRHDPESVHMTDPRGRTPLMLATLAGDDKLVSVLIKCHSAVNLQDTVGQAALHFAAQEGHVSTAQLLLDAGARIDISDQWGNQPLWTAVFNSRGHGSIIKLFLSRGADMNAKNKAGRSPLDLAASIANYNVIQFLES